ncbi:MAG TPA: glycosyltransferase family 2 protein [Burkholderiales bacterium]|nr:glycosyltransferase family 2 protein [Burkholderiales bacterium]
MNLSAVVITRNAAAQLGECLASVAFCDEVVVVDSGSTDDTQNVARAAGARVIEQAWLGYGPQKHFAVSQARHDWVLCLDADERVEPRLRDSIQRELRSPRARAYRMARCNRFLGRWLRHGEGYPDWSLRLFDRRAAQWSRDSVHEKVETVTEVARLDGDLLHDSADSLEGYLDKQNRYTSLQAQNLLQKGRKASALHLVVSPLARFAKFYVLRLGFLDGVAGLVHVCIGCMNSFNKYAKLMALQKALD